MKVGTVSLLVSPHVRGWRFGWKDGNGVWCYRTRKDKKDAVDDAREKARQLSNGKADVDMSADDVALWQRVKRLGITQADLDAWEKSRHIVSPKVSAVVAEMLKEKESARGGKGVHLRIMARDLKTLPMQEEPISHVRASDINAWLEAGRGRQVSQRRLKNLRNTAITLFRWARKRKYLPKGEVTAPEQTEEIVESRGKGKVAEAVVTYSPAELLALMAGVPAYWRGFVALGAFAGIRSDEIFPPKEADKHGMDWKMVDRDHGVIRLPAHITKTGSPRIIPIQPNLEAWLAHIEAPSEGPIIDMVHETARLQRREAVGSLWKRNGLRHSFGTYRTAQTQNLPQVALEMGNSVAVIRKNYLEAVTREKGEEWFAVMPPGWAPAVLSGQNSSEQRAVSSVTR